MNMPRVEFNFLVPAVSDEQLRALCRKDVVDIQKTLTEGEFIWSLQTFLELRNLGLPVSCSRNYKQGCINLGHFRVLNQLPPRPDVFVVSLQADYRRHGWASLHVVQNKTQVRGRSSYWLPHWPQPGLIPRDSNRSECVNIAFQGFPHQCAPIEKEFTVELEKRGLTFNMLGPGNWSDLSQIDVLVGIRSFGRRRYNHKPPTKLYNAWHAGIPFVGGFDSAYIQVGEVGVNFLRVSTPREFLQAVDKLTGDRLFYDQMVHAGRKEAKLYTRERIALNWIEFLEEIVIPRYRVWRENFENETRRQRLLILQDRLVRGLRRRARFMSKYLWWLR